jgi:hypothetical protein
MAGPDLQVRANFARTAGQRWAETTENSSVVPGKDVVHISLLRVHRRAGQMTQKKTVLSANEVLIDDIRQLIDEVRSGVATTVNAALTTLYWRIGERVRRDILKEKRAEYG